MANKQSQWFCPYCGVTLTLYIRPSEPPTHNCKKKLHKPIQLTKKETE